MEAQALQTPRLRNMERFIQATGKTQKDYLEWASQVGRQMHINTLDKLVCAKFGLYTVAHLPILATALPEGIDPEQVDDYLLVHSENPLEIARLWQSARVEADAWVSVESVLNEWLTGMPKEDYERWGDPNHLADVSRAWFKKGSRHLDVQLQEINEASPFVITEQDAIDFVTRYRPSSYKSPARLKLERLEERFKQLTTFKIKDYYADHLVRSAVPTVPALTEEVPF